MGECGRRSKGRPPKAEVKATRKLQTAKAKKQKASNKPNRPNKTNTRKPKSRPGPKPSITLAVVERVSERVGRGLTLDLALAAEGVETINVETWKKALKAHPEFSPLYQAAKGKFLDYAVMRLTASNDLHNLRWILERRHFDLFSRPRDDGRGQGEQSGGTTALPEDLLERARELAKTNAEKLKS